MHLFKSLVALLLFATLGLQAQEGFYYQAVIKNTDGSPLKETSVSIRIRIIEGETDQYTEVRTLTTSREGFVSFIIGEGATTAFTSINWQGELYLQDEIDTGAGYGAPTRMPLLKTPRSYISDRAISVLDNSITSASILDGTISNDDLSAAASISFSKLSISASDIEGLGFLQSDENFTSALKTKLDGIEAGADVTNAASVEAAGALMDSEVTNLADLKAFDPADYATAAQGTLADSAQQVLAEGAFVDGDKTKLDGVEAGANAYSLPTATSDILGGVKVGAGIVITDGVIAIGQAVGTSDDVSFNSVTAAIAGNVTGDILAADGTSILDNGTDGTDATFTGNVTGTVSSLANQDSDALTEGSTNLYFTDARAQGAITAGTGVSITSGQIAIGQAVGTSDDVSFNSVTAAIAGNVTGDILAADGTSILDNGTDGTDATFKGNSATATTLSSTLPINLGGTGSTSAPMIGVITAADEVAARTQLDILSDTFTWVLSDNTSQSKTVTVSGLTSTSIITVTPNSNINPQTFYVEPNNGSFTIYSSGNLTNGTTFSYIAIIK
jgi:hypothetical protein